MYTLTNFNSFIRDSDGGSIPFDSRNSTYLETIKILLKKKLVVVNKDNEITELRPDEKLLKSAPVINLDDFKAKAKQDIDEAARLARYRYITPNQFEVYLLKSQEAEKYKAAGYPQDDSEYLWLLAGKRKDNTTKEVADDIINKANLWKKMASTVEKIRLDGKADLDTKIKDTTIISSRDATIAALDDI